MQLVNLNEFDCKAYNLDMCSFDLKNSNANLLSCSLSPGCESESHNHFENELFIFTPGVGVVTNNIEKYTVSTGDAILFSSFEPHIVRNVSIENDLRFNSVYWSESAVEIVQGNDAENQNVLIFATAPTPNGELHLGHLSGPYLVADSLKRHLIHTGNNAKYISGFDHYQNYVFAQSLNSGETPTDICRGYSEKIASVWEMAGMMPDTLISPIFDEGYNDFVLYCIDDLYNLGFIYSAERMATFDNSGRYLHEALVSGICPHCRFVSDGNACEQCGRPNNCIDLENPISNIDGGPVHVDTCERLYFALSKFSEHLVQYVKSSSMSAKALNMSLQTIEDGLPDICISHPSPWGINHRIDGFNDQVVYVWFEMAFGYLWGASNKNSGLPLDRLNQVKQTFADADSIIHCYGFDNAYYHTILFPAIYQALGIRQPNIHIVNDLLYLDGEKFSTSRKHAIWGNDLLKDWYPDYVRFALSYFRPESGNTNFILKSAEKLVDRLFGKTLPSWISELDELKKQLSDHVVPEPGAWLPEHQKYFERLKSQQENIVQSSKIELFSPFDMAHLIEDMITEGDSFIVGQRPLFNEQKNTTDNYKKTSLALTIAGLNLITKATICVVPDLTEVILKVLGLDTAISSPNRDLFIMTGKRLPINLNTALPPVTFSN